MKSSNIRSPLVLGNRAIPYAEAKIFKPRDFQKGFMESVCPYPGFIAAWGTGKTLCGIMKGILLSFLYPGNKGLICRKVGQALDKSTISDFTDWTGLKVNKQTHIVEVPFSGGSTIVFAHAENLMDFKVTIQGMNLGWAEMEQVDEMDSAEVFEELQGRIRRVLTPCGQLQDKLIELGFLKRRVKNFENLSEDKRDEIEEAIIRNLHLPVRQLMVTGNACGHNWAWKRWIKQKWEGYKCWEADSFQNYKHIPKTTLELWRRLKIESPKRYARMVMNSHEDYDIEGSYYAAMMSDALKAERVDLDCLYDSQVPVYTFWDLGIRASDSTAIWFVQFIGEEIWLIDYLEDFGKGMEHYSRELSRKPYTYAAHYLPPDAVQRLQGREITTRLGVMRQLRREPIRVVERHRVEERIATVRGLLNRCKFNTKCERGVDALNNYKKKKHDNISSEDTPVFMSIPKHDEWSNGADAFGYMCIVKRYQPPTQDDAYNFFSDETEWLLDDGLDTGVTDLLRI